jgi:hypothetical protein
VNDTSFSKNDDKKIVLTAVLNLLILLNPFLARILSVDLERDNFKYFVQQHIIRVLFIVI